MDNHPSFATRIADLQKAAQALRDISTETLAIAETVMTEVLHMEAAQKRFSERRPARPMQKASR